MASASYICPKCNGQIEIRGGFLDGPNMISFALNRLIEAHNAAGCGRVERRVP